MRNIIRPLAIFSLSVASASAAGATLDDLDFTRQVSSGDFTAIPLAESNSAFVWAQKVKASYEFRSSGAGSPFQTLTVVFKPAYSKEDRDRFLNAAGLQDRGSAEAFTYFRKDEISCKFSDSVLQFFAENQQPAPKVTTLIGGYPSLCTLSVRVPASWNEDLVSMLKENRGLTFRAQPVLCRKDSPKVAVKDLLRSLESKGVGQTLASGDWQAPYLNLVYESVSLTLNEDSLFAQKGGRKLWEKFFSPFTVDTAQNLATLRNEAVAANLNVCYEQPLEINYAGAEVATL